MQIICIRLVVDFVGGMDDTLECTMPDEGPSSADARLRSLGELSAGIVHELRNALQVIASAAYVAEQRPEVSKEELARIRRTTESAQRMVSDLLLLTRGIDGVSERCRLVDLIARAREEFSGREVAWDDEALTSTIIVNGHSGLLSRLLCILYENAIQISAPRIVAIRTTGRLQHRQFILAVSDDGPGVAEEIASRIFEPLVSGREGGSGVGLALARRIAEAHGGEIRLTESPLGGAGFELVLPQG